MNLEKVQHNLEGIREVLGSLQTEMLAMESAYMSVLEKLELMQQESGRDDLTGLLRRKPFFAKWDRLLKHCQEIQEESGVMIIDIDHFKKINDTYGHATGDEVIKRVSALLRTYENATCFSGRLGGEEFALVMTGSSEDVEALAEEIREEVSHLHGEVVGASENSSDKTWKCTVSIGFAKAGVGGVDPNELLHRADLALYASKKGGRNKVSSAA